WVPEARARHGRPVNVLGIIVPTVEAAAGLPWSYEAERHGEKVEGIDIVGAFCTAATAGSRVYEVEIDKRREGLGVAAEACPGLARSRVYEIEIDNRREDLAVFAEACPGLAGLIELGAPAEELRVVVEDHVDALRRRIGRQPDKAILGCTHYEIVADVFAAAL